jgi:lipoprotein-releasing system permease protein
MNFPIFISRRIVKSSPGSFSRIINRVAILSIGLGLSILIIAFLILEGFENTIKNKIFSFGAHIHIAKYSVGNSYEQQPLSIDGNFYKHAKQIEGVTHIQAVAHKAGLIKTGQEVQGVVFRGVGPDFNLSAFKENISEGSFLNFNDSTVGKQVLISRKIANLLDLKLNDEFVIYFIQIPPRYRKLKIVGIYETSMEEFDRQFIIGPLSTVQRLNNWPDTAAGAYEVYVNDPEKMEFISGKIDEVLDFDLYPENITDKYIQIFDWLTLLNKNVNIFFVILLVVAAFNMVAVVFILIMERTQMIGMLKAMGATNKQVRQIFIFNGIMLVAKGLIIGNIIGLGLCYIQDKFRLITLDPENYYMKFVPISWNWPVILGLNGLTMLLITVVLMIPTMIVSGISPVKAIRFD